MPTKSGIQLGPSALQPLLRFLTIRNRICLVLLLTDPILLPSHFPFPWGSSAEALVVEPFRSRNDAVITRRSLALVNGRQLIAQKHRDFLERGEGIKCTLHVEES